MTITIPQAAAQAYANTGKIGPGMEPRTGAGGFADLVKSAADQTVTSLQEGEAASAAAVAGSGNLTDVVTAVSHAEATLQTVIAVRDRVIQAYQDILKMPI